MRNIKEEILKSNNSYRNKTFSSKALVPKYIEQNIDKFKSILDFGSGKDIFHCQKLREQGFTVDAFDYGKNFIKGIHTSDALNNKYDVVYASNVMNVQSNLEQLKETLSQIKNCINPNGQFIFNFPKNPRYLNLTDKQLLEIIKLYFNNIQIHKFGSSNIYIAN